MFRQSYFFTGVGLILAWGCLFAVLATGNDSGADYSFRNSMVRRNVVSHRVAAGPKAVSDAVDILEQECPNFSLSELRMRSLESLVAEAGLRLVYSKAQEGLKWKNVQYTNKYLSDILVDLFRPSGYGFFRQGSCIYVTEMTLKQERKEPKSNGESPLQSSLVRTTIHARVGEPIDIWVDNNPLMRLRILVQPAYGETQSNWMGIIAEGYRNQERWFYQKMKTEVGKELMVDVKAGGQMWCQIVPVSLSGKEITLKIEFYYETIASVS